MRIGEPFNIVYSTNSEFYKISFKYQQFFHKKTFQVILPVTFQTMGAYWNQNYLDTATFLDIAGTMITEGSYDAETLYGLKVN